MNKLMHFDAGPPAVNEAGTTVPELPIPDPNRHLGPAAAQGADVLPSITVVIPTKDRPELIRRSVATALAQEGVTVEVIVVDDGSTVPAVDVLPVDPRLKVLRSPVPEGVASARNRGIAAASCDWIAFLDDDDLWAPNKLACQVEATATGDHAWSHTGTFRLTERLDIDRFWPLAHDETHLEMLLAANRVSTPSTVLVSAAALDEVGGFDPAFSIMADWDLWIRLSTQWPGVVIGEPLVGYVVHPASMHRQHTRAHLRELKTLKRKHNDLGRVQSAQALRWIARIRWDTGARFAALRPAVTAGVLFAMRGWFSADGLVGRVRRGLGRRLRSFRKPAPSPPSWITKWTAPGTAAAPSAHEPPR